MPTNQYELHVCLVYIGAHVWGYLENLILFESLHQGGLIGDANVCENKSSFDQKANLLRKPMKY